MKPSQKPNKKAIRDDDDGWRESRLQSEGQKIDKMRGSGWGHGVD